MSIRLLSFMTILAGVVVTAGCASAIRHPQGGMASVEFVYSPLEIGSLIAKAPSQSKKATLFAASYEDVYRAAFVSASQTQINIETENKSKGLMLGTRAVEAVPPIPRCQNSERLNGVSLPRKYFYAIVVTEKGPKSTEVLATVKVQGACWTGVCFQSVDLAECTHYSTPHWADLGENPERELTQLMTFIRNNLIAAGVL